MTSLLPGSATVLGCAGATGITVASPARALNLFPPCRGRNLKPHPCPLRNVSTVSYRALVDEQLILDTAEAAAPALRALARDILAAEARHRGVSLDAADVLLRRAVDAPAAHITAAADQLLEHQAAAKGIILPERGIVAVLARAGAQLLMSGIELDWSAAEAQL